MTIYSPNFWNDEYLRYIEQINPMVLQIFFAGAESGAALLPQGIELLINWEYFNQAAIDFLQSYGSSWARSISATTERQVIKSVSNWIQSGAKFDNLVKQLETILSPNRARMIAVTEVTRVFAEGNITSWKSTGLVTGKRWRTAYDDKVCPICMPLHNMLVEIDANGFTTEVNGMGLYAPPAHINCRCWLQPVVDDSLLEEIIART